MKTGLCRLLVAAFLLGPCLATAQPQPFTVNGYYGRFDAPSEKAGPIASRLQPPVKEAWTVPVPKRAYRIGVLLPTRNDAYWTAVNYGIVSHARRLGLETIIYFVENYLEAGNQRRQLGDFLDRSIVDGIILATVDYRKMDRFVDAAAAAGLPVVGLINDIQTPNIQARAMVSYYDAGKMSGEYVMQDAAGRDIRVALFPGPKGSGWAEEMVRGFTAAVAAGKTDGQSVRVASPRYGDTRADVQRLRVSDFFAKIENRDTDYVVGNAVAAMAASAYLKENNLPNTKIVSTYLTGDLYDLIKNGDVLAAPCDQPRKICQIALDMMTRLLNGEEAGKDFPFRAGPEYLLVTKDNISRYSYEQLFGPRNFRPVFNAAP